MATASVLDKAIGNGEGMPFARVQALQGIAYLYSYTRRDFE